MNGRCNKLIFHCWPREKTIALLSFTTKHTMVVLHSNPAPQTPGGFTFSFKFTTGDNTKVHAKIHLMSAYILPFMYRFRIEVQFSFIKLLTFCLKLNDEKL